MRDKTKLTRWTDAEMALIEAASAVSHPTATGGNVARMIREGALDTAEETIRQDISESTLLNALNRFEVLNAYRREQSHDGHSGLDWYNDGALRAVDLDEALSVSVLIGAGQDECVNTEGHVIVWNAFTKAWESDESLLGERFDERIDNPAVAEVDAGDLDKAAALIEQGIDLVTALGESSSRMFDAVDEWVRDLMAKLSEKCDEDIAPDEGEGVLAWTATHLIRVSHVNSVFEWFDGSIEDSSSDSLRVTVEDRKPEWIEKSNNIGEHACRASDLDELQEALQLHADLFKSVKHIDGLAHDLMVNLGGWIADVPSWGDEPDDTEGLVSFDATRLLWMEDYSVSQRDVSLESLEDLQAAMKDEHPSILDGDDWSTDLPTFGGDEPDDTAGVWSWDAERLLVGTCADDLTIYTRDEWDDQ